MKRLEDAAREAGIHLIECPSCRKKFNTNKMFKALFQGILDLVNKGERVNIPKFGMFHIVEYGAREHTSPVIPGGKVKAGPKRVFKFKQNAHTRRVLNPPSEEGRKRGQKANAASRASREEARQAMAELEKRKKAHAAKTKKTRTKKAK